MAINELRAIEIFAKAVELGSLRKAAAVQGLSPQAVSQAVSQLEHHLGVRLLHRTTRNIALTEEGQQLLEATRPALAILERALRRVRASKDEISGSLHIVAPRSGFLSVLWPVINAFCQKYPGIQPDLHLDDQIADWVQERADVGFRIGAPPEEGLVARRLFPVQLIICASPSYLERYGTPSNLEELSTHRCSVFRHPSTGKVFPWFLKIGGDVVNHDFPPTFSTNDVEIELQAVLDGQVIAQLSSISVAPHIRSGRIIPLLVQHMSDHMNVTLFYGSRRAQPARVRYFIDFAIDQLINNPNYVLSDFELTSSF